MLRLVIKVIAHSNNNRVQYNIVNIQFAIILVYIYTYLCYIQCHACWHACIWITEEGSASPCMRIIMYNDNYVYVIMRGERANRWANPIYTSRMDLELTIGSLNYNLYTHAAWPAVQPKRHASVPEVSVYIACRVCTLLSTVHVQGGLAHTPYAYVYL